MCGLLFQINKNKFSKQDVTAILESLALIKHRGPDGEGVLFIHSLTGKKWILKTDDTPSEINCNGTLASFPELTFDICMAHRRLSIFDLSTAGHQPLTNENGNVIIFNGEIYNFKEIKEELIKLGYQFKTQTDTEVILYAYHQWKEKAIEKFNGMFSFIIWDNTEKKVFVCNDRYGVKPLYYYQNKEKKIFTSEIKQFLPFKVTNQFNWSKIKDFLKFGLIDHDYDTLLENIYRFPNAHYSCFDTDELFTAKTYYKINRIDVLAESSSEIKNFPILFKDAVALRLRADVPWGIGASGGLDSSLVLYMANRIQQENKTVHRVKTFSAIAPGHSEDESEFIKFIEQDLDIQSFYVNPVNEFTIDDFIKHIWHQDGPVLSTSFYAQWNVARLAKKNGVTVLLAGQGADELFAGYHHHFYRYCRYLLEKFHFSALSNEIKGYSEIKQMDPKVVWKTVTDELKLKYKILLGVRRFDNPIYKKRIATASAFELLHIDFTQAMLPYYLRSDDRTSMAFSIETRHPFLDYRIVDFAFKLSFHHKIKNGWQKHLLRAAFDYVPDKLRYRKDKKGFTTPKELIQQEIGKTYQVSDELIGFCKKEKIDMNINQVNIQSLSLWMNMIKKYKAI